ncbi:MAG: LysE family transporter [Bacteroidota bacterium]|nr:LysE family transporter [Bacteroidota bacterium]MDP4214370.1 LysE family transporter [Bacteroidota bacterium]MDP4248857.1 LysE family transporter [Bacteroidota bacterium]
MIEAIWKGLALGIVLALSVGPIIFTIIKQSLTSGHKGGLSFVAGVWLSDLILVILSNVFTEWVTRLLEYKKLIGYGGSSFLIALGVYFFFFKKVHLKSTAAVHLDDFSVHDMLRTFASGFIINTLNPGVLAFWLGNATVLALTHTLKQRIIIFSTCLIINMGADVGKVMMAGKLRKRLTVHNLSIINKISGGILIAFGIALLYGVIFLEHRIR